MRSKKSGGNRIISIGFLMFAAAVFLTLYPGVVSAHSPSEVKISYDMPTQTLQATITHTRFSDSHYVNQSGD